MNAIARGAGAGQRLVGDARAAAAENTAAGGSTGAAAERIATDADHDGDSGAGNDADTTVVAGRAVGNASLGIEPGSTEAHVIDAVVACAGRWGIEKTTVEDVAREAGVSRATVYRLFPGGKPSMVKTATEREVVALLSGLLERLDRCDTLEEAVVEMLSGGTRAVEQQPAIAYMRAHDPAAVRAFFSFERLDGLFLQAAGLLSGSLERFLEPPEARTVVIWVARLVVSHYLNPDPEHPLADPRVARRLVEEHVLPGLALTAVSP